MEKVVGEIDSYMDLMPLPCTRHHPSMAVSDTIKRLRGCVIAHMVSTVGETTWVGSLATTVKSFPDI